MCIALVFLWLFVLRKTKSAKPDLGEAEMHTDDATITAETLSDLAIMTSNIDDAIGMTQMNLLNTYEQSTQWETTMNQFSFEEGTWPQ